MTEGRGTRKLQTVLFTDIVSSTAVATKLGDARWRDLLSRHHAIVRHELKRFRGREIDTAGDGFFATFDAPADAVRCACAASDAVRELGIEIRAGLHFGETEEMRPKVAGIAVVTAARIAALAGSGEVLVSSTIEELVAGSGLGLEDRGRVELKGISGERHVFAVASLDGSLRAPPLDPDEAAERRARFAAVRHARPRRRTVVLVAVATIALVAATLPFVLHRGNGAPALAANGIQLIDATSGQRVGSVPLLGSPGGLASGGGSVWVSDPQAGTVVKLDPTTRAAVDTIPVGRDPAGIAFGDGAVWVAVSGDGELARIDPSTDTVVLKVGVGNGPTGVAVSPGFVWVTNYTDDTVVRVDATTNLVVSRVDVGHGPVSVAANAAGAWVADSGDGTVTRIPLGGQGTTPIRVGNGPSGIAIGPTGVWVTNTLDGTLSRIDADTGAVLQTTPVGDGPTGVTVESGTVWVADHFGGAIARVDPATGTPSAPIQMDAAPVAMTLVRGELWVAASAPRSAHRGGTLRFASELAPDTIDPAIAYDLQDWQIVSLTNDGLVGFERVGGPQGGAIVPDLATSVPVPSDGGKTYTFQLRPGIHYSSGATVEPQDFRLGIERVLLVLRPQGPQVPYYSGIVGAARCISVASCDLTKGIVVNDASRTVTFHLTAPDPEFLYKLAMPFADAVPAGTPLTPIGTTPIPATGPYMIASYTPGPKGSIELVRNPRFVEWSRAAQPEGYPDRIEGSYGISPAQQVPRIEQGQLDVTDDSPPPHLLSQLDTRYPSQLSNVVLPYTLGFALNRHVPPFDDVGVRRALNYAVDRRELVRIAGGPKLAQVSCQILPPDFPGYQPYCPYTLHPSASGTWSAPDPGRARRLVAASGTRGAQITVWAPRHFPYESEGRYLVSVLHGLGYRARLHVLSVNRYFPQMNDPHVSATVQISFYPWAADYPTPSGTLVPLFACDSVGTNTSHFCDRGVQTQMNKALALQANDPAAAREAWGRVDRSIVNRAPWLALPTPQQVYFVSTRTSNVQVNPQWGMLLSQLWIL